MTSQELSLEAILFKLARTADWRRNLAAQYDDPRNDRAAETLDRLACADSREVSAATWSALAPYLESPSLRNGVSDAARDVEFRRRPDNVDDFLQIVVEKLTAPSRD